MAIASPIAGARIVTSDLAAFYNLLKGVSGSGESITLIYNAAGGVVLQPSSDPATGTELIQIKNNAGTVQMALSSDGKVYAADGTAPLPGVTWEQDKDTGIYRVTTNVLGFAAGGSEKARIDATGLSLDGGTTYLGSTAVDASTNYARFRYEPSYGVATGPVVTSVGTGSVTVPAGERGVLLATGTTNPSSTGIRLLSNTAALDTRGVGAVRRIEITTMLSNVFASTNAYIYLTDESADIAPSGTARHLGIKNLNGTVSFTTGDNVTEQTTAITAFVTAAQYDRFVITYNGTTALCYINGTLRATHATNVPSVAATPVILRAFIDNNASINGRSLRLSIVEALISAS